MTSYNPNQISAVKLLLAYRSLFLIYKPEKAINFFGLFKIITQKEGFYFRFVSDDYKGKEVPKGHYFKDGIVYENPHILIFFGSQKHAGKRLEYNTATEAKAAYENYCKISNLIPLIP